MLDAIRWPAARQVIPIVASRDALGDVLRGGTGVVVWLDDDVSSARRTL
jgi:hypothetical protein